MSIYNEILWAAFERTGSVRDYLKFKLFEAEKMKVEAGEDFVTSEDLRDSFEDNQVR